MPQPFRFAAELKTPLPGSTWLDSAREVEALGYSTVFVPDHVPDGPGPIAAMASFAAVTDTIRVGALVLDCDFRHPAILAKELAMIDVVSNGRLEIGLGAGWKAADYDITGIPMDRGGVRVSRLQEHAGVLRGSWGGEPYSCAGDHYTITDFALEPRPTTEQPTLLIGGGSPRILRWAGANADIVGIAATIRSGVMDLDAARDSLADRVDEKVAWVREGAGERFGTIELNTWLAAAEVTEDRDHIAAVAELFGVSVEDLHATPAALFGGIGEVAERLVERRERWGINYTVIPGDQARAFAPVVDRLTGT